jgi:hypothetical protein
MPAPPDTEMAALVAGTLGTAALAVMAAVPEATPVIVTATAVELGEKVTDAGTVATAGLLEASETVSPVEGAGEESISVMLCCTKPLMVRAGGMKVRVAPTRTSWLAEA